MGNEGLNQTIFSTPADGTATAWTETRKLRLEIQELRRRLKASDDAAAQNAVLLREGDHRIKNSLQLVSSLMSLQARRESSAAVRDALLVAAARVGSVASIHDALHRNGGNGLVDLGEALRVACASLQIMAGDTGHVDIAVGIESLKVPVAQAQPLILAVNELVVNALRHAFHGRETGSVRVSLSHDDKHLRITVADDGAGLSAGRTNGHGYGMTLVNMMMKQIGAELQAETRAGTCFTIHAPLVPAIHTL